MALTATKKTLCNKLVSDYDALVAPVKSAKSALRTAKNKLDTFIRSMTFSDEGAINNAIDTLTNTIEGMIPGSDAGAMDDLADFINNCSYLSGLSPISSMINAKDGIFDAIDNLLDSIDLTVPEFGAAKLAQVITKLLNGLGLPGGDALGALLKKADELINCLSGLCAAVDPSYVGTLSTITTDLQSLYSDLNIVDDPLSPKYGEFDFETLYNDIGLSLSQKDKLDTVRNSVETSQSDAVTAINSSVGAVKNVIKSAGSFF